MCCPDDFAALPAFLSFVCEMCWLIRAIDIKWPPGPLKWPRRSSLKHWERQAASSSKSKSSNLHRFGQDLYSNDMRPTCQTFAESLVLSEGPASQGQGALPGEPVTRVTGDMGDIQELKKFNRCAVSRLSILNDLFKKFPIILNPFYWGLGGRLDLSEENQLRWFAALALLQVFAIAGTSQWSPVSPASLCWGWTLVCNIFFGFAHWISVRSAGVSRSRM